MRIKISNQEFNIELDLGSNNKDRLLKELEGKAKDFFESKGDHDNIDKLVEQIGEAIEKSKFSMKNQNINGFNIESEETDKKRYNYSISFKFDVESNNNEKELTIREIVRGMNNVLKEDEDRIHQSLDIRVTSEEKK